MLALLPPRRPVVAAALQRWAAAEQGRPVLWLPVCMGAGVLGYFSLRAEPAAWLGPALAAASLALCAAAWRTRAGRATGAAALRRRSGSPPGNSPRRGRCQSRRCPAPPSC